MSPRSGMPLQVLLGLFCMTAPSRSFEQGIGAKIFKYQQYSWLLDSTAAWQVVENYMLQISNRSESLWTGACLCMGEEMKYEGSGGSGTQQACGFPVIKRWVQTLGNGLPLLEHLTPLGGPTFLSSHTPAPAHPEETSEVETSQWWKSQLYSTNAPQICPRLSPSLAVECAEKSVSEQLCVYVTLWILAFAWCPSVILTHREMHADADRCPGLVPRASDKHWRSTWLVSPLGTKWQICHPVGFVLQISCSAVETTALEPLVTAAMLGRRETACACAETVPSDTSHTPSFSKGKDLAEPP